MFFLIFDRWILNKCFLVAFPNVALIYKRGGGSFEGHPGSDLPLAYYCSCHSCRPNYLDKALKLSTFAVKYLHLFCDFTQFLHIWDSSSNFSSKFLTKCITVIMLKHNPPTMRYCTLVSCCEDMLKCVIGFLVQLHMTVSWPMPLVTGMKSKHDPTDLSKTYTWLCVIILRAYRIGPCDDSTGHCPAQGKMPFKANRHMLTWLDPGWG